MSDFVTLDFETHYADKYSLTSMTYEQYIKDERFLPQCVGIKINDEKTFVVFYDDIQPALREVFYPGNKHTAIAHNMLFDGFILSFYYGLRAANYICTQAISRALWNQQPSSLEYLVNFLYPNHPTIKKGKELVKFKNIQYLNAAQQKVMGKYCGNDVDITFHALRKLWPMMPDSELAILDLTLQMAIHPGFELDTALVAEHLKQKEQDKAEVIKNSGIAKTTLASPAKFVNYIRDNFGLEVPIIHAPTKKNPDNRKRTLAKGEVICQQFIRENPQVKQAFEARFCVASTLETSRSVRLLQHAEALPFKPAPIISLPLNYAKAHTIRWGGTNKINPQNFGRNSPLRRAIRAPQGYKVLVCDLSNIEARVLAWWANETSLIQLYKNKADVYNIYGEKIYKRKIDRKREIPHPETGKMYKPDFIEGHVAKTTVLGLGYQMGAAKFQNTLAGGANGGPPVFLSIEQCHYIVHDIFRAENQNIVQAWNECNQVIIDMMTMKPGTSYKWRHLVVEPNRLRLPNGLYLNYPRLRVKEGTEESGWPEFEYWNGKHWTKIYPGKLVENIIQALARIILAENMLLVNKYLLSLDGVSRVLLTVHDETVSIIRDDLADQALIKNIELMCTCPSWASPEFLILDAEGGYDDCYSK